MGVLQGHVEIRDKGFARLPEKAEQVTGETAGVEIEQAQAFETVEGKELFQLYRDGEFSDETGRNGAVCLLVATLLSRKAGKLSDEDIRMILAGGMLNL